MPELQSSKNKFISKITEIVEANVTNPQFGVSLLAKEMGMSRSNLHWKVNSELKITVSQFINHVRLKKAKDILRHTSKTVSEVAYEVGYSNVSYFIKCFHKYYGYSPGKVGNREEEENNFKQPFQTNKKAVISIVSIVVIAVVLILFIKPFPFQRKNSIIFLPIENYETNDTTAIFGILENIKTNLCYIDDLVLKPSINLLQPENSKKSKSEIAKKHANYSILPKTWTDKGKTILSLLLFDARKNSLIETFPHEVNSDNFTIVHLEYIKDITDRLDVNITPEEQVKIDKLITSNDTAWMHYWEGMEFINQFQSGLKTDLRKAIICFENALKHDSVFVSANAQLARIYYLIHNSGIERFKPDLEISCIEQINKYADRAMSLDSQFDLSLYSKALYYISLKDYDEAVYYLERALKYNHNFFLAINHLAWLNFITGDYVSCIEYSLDIIKSDFPENEIANEIGKERVYLQLGISYRGLGFFGKAMEFLELAIQENPEYFAPYAVKAQLICDMEKDENNYQDAIHVYEELMDEDSAKIGNYRSLGLLYFIKRDYKKAYDIYKIWLERQEINLEDYKGRCSGRLAYIFNLTGEHEKARILLNNYRDRAVSQESANFRCFYLTGYYSLVDSTGKAMEQLKELSKYDRGYATIRLLKDDPIYDNIRGAAFDQILAKMQARWQERHDSIRIVFKKKKLL